MRLLSKVSRNTLIAARNAISSGLIGAIGRQVQSQRHLLLGFDWI